MAAGDLITQPWQVELNGLLMGDNVYKVRSFDPWAAPVVRPSENPRAQAHGMFSGRDWLGERLVQLELGMLSATYVDEQAARRALAGAWQPAGEGETDVLVWMEDDGARYCLFGKPRLADTRVEPRLYSVCRFIATDPRIYSATVSTASASLPTASGGLTFPAAAPFVFGSAGSGGSIAATNSGTFETPWTATFTGPLVAPTLTHTGQGKTLSFTGTLAAGETLVLDSVEKTVLLNGTASRYSWLAATSQWFTLPAGANALQFGGASGTGTCSVSWRSAWL